MSATETERTALESLQDVHVERYGVVDDLVEELLPQIDFALPQRGLVGLALVPPEFGAGGDQRTHACIPPLILIDQRDSAAKEPPHLIAQPGADTPSSATIAA